MPASISGTWSPSTVNTSVLGPVTYTLQQLMQDNVLQQNDCYNSSNKCCLILLQLELSVPEISAGFSYYFTVITGTWEPAP
jgi:hypothetical protein